MQRLPKPMNRVHTNIEAVSKIGFWFKIAAGPSFPAKRDFPTDHILFVGRKPQAYFCMSRI